MRCGYVVYFDKDIVLHGSYGGAAGRLTPAGSNIAYGEYNVAVPGKVEPIVIQFESPMPMLYDPHMGMVVDCDLHSAQWGDGKAYGMQGMAMSQPDGKVVMPTRNVLTFPSQ